jgi:hypothetical protein
LVENDYIWRILNLSWIFFGEGSIKVTHSKEKNIKLWGAPIWDVPTTN